MILHVMDENFSYRGRIENFRSLRWIEQYQGTGGLTLIVDDTDQNAAVLRRGCILFRGDRKTAMQIVKISRSTADATIRVYGHTTLILLDRRIILGKYAATNPETGIYDLVRDNLRGLSSVAIAPAQGYEGETQAEFEDDDLLRALWELCEEGDLGVRMDYDHDGKQHIFQVYRGRDLAYKEDGGLVFSNEFGNMLSVSVDEDDSLHKNVCYVRGQRGKDDPVLVEVGDAEGVERREMIIQGSSKTDEQTDDQYTQALQQEGKEALQECYDVTNFKAEINPEKFGAAYDLGDLVTCNATKYGVRFDARITEFEEDIDQGFRRVYITMGKPTITYAKSILAQIKQ